MSDNQVRLKMNAATNRYLALGVDDGTTEDADARFELQADGKHLWGNGTDDQDVNLYRNAANELKTDDVLTSALGFKEPVTTYTTTGAVVTYGTVALSATAATTYNLPDPTIGIPVNIVSTTTNSQTVVMATTNGVKFGTTGVSITFATPASVTLMPVTATRWQIISSYSTGVAFA